jgi:hypothetical protein
MIIHRMGSIADLDITETINSSLEFFLTSLQGGNDSLTSFLWHWSSLNDTVQSRRDHLSAETLATAHNVASIISTIASRMLNLETQGTAMEKQLAEDISHILNDDMENLTICDELPISRGKYLQVSIKHLRLISYRSRLPSLLY